MRRSSEQPMWQSQTEIKESYFDCITTSKALHVPLELSLRAGSKFIDTTFCRTTMDMSHKFSQSNILLP